MEGMTGPWYSVLREAEVVATLSEEPACACASEEGNWVCGYGCGEGEWEGPLVRRRVAAPCSFSGNEGWNGDGESRSRSRSMLDREGFSAEGCSGVCAACVVCRGNWME